MAAEGAMGGYLVICGACGDGRSAVATRRHCGCGLSSWRTRNGSLVLAGPTRAYRQDLANGGWMEVDTDLVTVVRPTLVA